MAVGTASVSAPAVHAQLFNHDLCGKVGVIYMRGEGRMTYMGGPIAVGATGLTAVAAVLAAIICTFSDHQQQHQTATTTAAAAAPASPVHQHAHETTRSIDTKYKRTKPPVDLPAEPPITATDSLSDLSCDETALFAWLRDGGAFIHPALVLRPSAHSAGNTYQQGLARDQDIGVYVNGSIIEADELLFSVPESPFALSTAAVVDVSARLGDDDESANATLHHYNALLRGTEDVQLQLASNFIHDEESARRYLSLAVALLCERRKAQLGASRWRPYLACLPPISACPALPCFNKHERKALQDNFAAEAARTEQATLRKAYETIDWEGLEGGCFDKPPRKAEWLWAVSCYLFCCLID